LILTLDKLESMGAPQPANNKAPARHVLKVIDDYSVDEGAACLT
jgi:hypothetical protein